MCRNLQAESASSNIARVSVKLHTKCSSRNFILFFLIPQCVVKVNRLRSDSINMLHHKYDRIRIKKKKICSTLRSPCRRELSWFIRTARANKNLSEIIRFLKIQERALGRIKREEKEGKSEYLSTDTRSP